MALYTRVNIVILTAVILFFRNACCFWSLATFQMPVVFGVRQHLVSGRRSNIPKRFQCSFCAYSSDKSWNLRTHMASHSGHRPYRCSQCGSAFTLKHHLRNHMIVHTRERPFECETCGMAFGWKSHLRRHALIHCKDK